MQIDRGVLYTATAGVLFGVGGVVAANAFAVVEPVVVAQYRSVMAAIVLGFVAYQRRVTSTGGRLGELAVFGAMLASVTITFYWAIERLGVGMGVTIQFLAPVLVLVWMRLVQGRHVAGFAWVAAGLAVAGTALMTRAWNLASLDPVGVLAGLGAMGSFAAYLLIGERLSSRLPGLTVVAYGFAVSALIWVIVVPPTIVDVSATAWAQLVWVGLLGTAVPFLLMMSALRSTDPGTVGVVATIEPVVATGGAWIALGQSLSIVQMVGGIFVVLGVATIQRIVSVRAPAQL